MNRPALPDPPRTLRQRAAVRTRFLKRVETVRRRRELKREQRSLEWYRAALDLPVDPDTVLYEAFHGNGVLDNPEALFRHLLARADMQHLTHVWSLDTLARHKAAQREFAAHPRVRFVAHGTRAHEEALATAGYLVNNSTWPQRFLKREGQTYLNTWHGVPLKHMGMDMRRGGVESRNVTRNFLHADYLLSANPFMTEVMYRGAYRLQGVFEGAVIEEGQPRLDVQHAADADHAEARRSLAAKGLVLDERPVVLLAPTWRGRAFAQAVVDLDLLRTTVDTLRRELGPDVQVLLKTHQSVHDLARDGLTGDFPLVDNDIPTNLLLGVTDVLITDYSSIFFDFLATKRPVVFFSHDLETYADRRGLYLTPEELPGPVCGDLDQLVREVQDALGRTSPSERSLEAAARYTPYDDGGVCERITALVFQGAEESAYRVHRDFGTQKEKLLIYLGGMKSNGIMSSAHNLLRHLDHDRFDVTAYWWFSRGRIRSRNAQLVDPRVRVLPRAATYVGTKQEVERERFRLLNEGVGTTLSEEHLTFWRREYHRMFGDATFDYLVDFSGYGCFSPFLFTGAPNDPVTSIWLHNDMRSDHQRETAGVRHLESRLGSVFTTYRHMDRLVSVSPSLNELNKQHLADHADPEQFTYAMNTIDGDRILELAGQDPAEAVGRGEMPPEDFFAEATTVFVSVGRLSPEKNQARMIEAFARVHARNPQVRLLVLGGGGLEEELHDLVERLGLHEVVHLAGQVDNPFPFMRRSDCFVLSSNYEGQPMVILEARVLGMPVVTTDFDTVHDSMPPGAGLVVRRDVGALAEGLEAFLAGDVPASTLDVERYNEAA
ncbi:MAG: tagF, partial [Marmoricola sp.]|nr:tagF [Marmoricola sp.]